MDELRTTPQQVPPSCEEDGRHDFDFLFGRWAVANRKLRTPVDSGSGNWDRFTAHVTTRPAVGGLGNIDHYVAPDFPGRPGFEALAVRLFDPGIASWRIWWASTATPGVLDTPVVGRFIDRVGVFECDDVIEGRAVRVRYEWSGIMSFSPRWEQSFSFDEGATWRPNWTMDWRRRADR